MRHNSFFKWINLLDKRKKRNFAHYFISFSTITKDEDKRKAQ